MTTWIETAKRAPTRADSVECGLVIAMSASGVATIEHFKDVIQAPIPYWLPIPPLPVKRDAVADARAEMRNARTLQGHNEAIEALIVAIVAKERER